MGRRFWVSKEGVKRGSGSDPCAPDHADIPAFRENGHLDEGLGFGAWGCGVWGVGFGLCGLGVGGEGLGFGW